MGLGCCFVVLLLSTGAARKAARRTSRERVEPSRQTPQPLTSAQKSSSLPPLLQPPLLAGLQTPARRRRSWQVRLCLLVKNPPSCLLQLMALCLNMMVYAMSLKCVGALQQLQESCRQQQQQRLPAAAPRAASGAGMCRAAGSARPPAWEAQQTRSSQCRRLGSCECTHTRCGLSRTTCRSRLSSAPCCSNR